MSFILQFFHQPQVQSPLQAEAYISNHSALVPGNKKRFNAFLREVTAYLPTGEVDDDGEDDRILWPEGLSEADADEAEFTISVKTELIDWPIMGVIARAAAQSGLQILDPQNGLLYLLDSTFVDLHGRVQQFPTPAPLPRRTLKSRTPKLAAETVLAHFHDIFAPQLEPAGFASRIDGDTVVSERNHGCTRQQFRFQCMLYAGRVEINADWQISCDTLHPHWQAVFEPAYTQCRRHWPAHEPDFRYHLSFSPIQNRVRREGLAISRVADAQEMQRYAKALAGWVDDVLTLGLEPANTIAGLGAVILDEAWRKDEIHLHNNYSIRTAANQLILAALSRPLQLDDWIELAHKRFNEYQWRDRLDDIEGRYLDKLIDYAKALAQLGAAAT